MATTPVDSKAEQARAYMKAQRALDELSKSLDEGALRDVRQLESVTDGHGRNGMPSATEVPTGPAQAMRGGQASTQIAAHSDFKPQSGNMADYESLASRLGAMEKSVGSIAQAVKDISAATVTLKGAVDIVLKADDEDKKEEDKEVEKALRKARIEVRKATDDEDKDDWMEKATAALSAADLAIGKAEDDADDDDKEKASEKARSEFRALKAKLVTVAKAREVAKAEKVEAAAKAAEPAPVVVAAAPAAPSEDVLRKAAEEFFKSTGHRVDALMDKLSAQSRGTSAPPVFAKAVQDSSGGALLERAETAAAAGELNDVELMKCESIIGRVNAAKAGKYDMALVINEIGVQTEAVQRVFTPVAA